MKSILHLACLILISLSLFAHEQVEDTTNPKSPFELNPLSGMKIYTLLDFDLEPSLFKDINIPAFQTISGAISFTDKDNQQKIVFSPFRLMNKYVRILSDTSILISQKEGITTFGIGCGLIDSSSPNYQMEKKNRIWQHLVLPSLPIQGPTENDSEYKKVVLSWNERFIKNVSSLLGDIRMNVYKLSLAYNIQFFKAIGGDRIDKNQNGLIDNEFSVKSHNYSVNLSYSYKEKIGGYLIGHYSKKRASSEQGQKLVPYYGGTIGASVNLLTLNTKYMYTEDYLVNGFIPAIVFGLTYEYLKCTGENAFCENGIKASKVITPYFDIKITPANQFRIGIPIRRDRMIADDKATYLGVFLQYGFQIASI